MPETIAEMLAEVPSTAALWAAAHLGARIVPRGTCGETGHAWLCRGGRWYHDDGYRLVPCDESDVGDDVEILDWPDASGWEIPGLEERTDKVTTAEYEAVADEARRRGESAEFALALKDLHGSYEVDETLVERLAATGGEIEP